ncbi:hypothetical protein BVY03_04585 [bacterium K02(2017)]|nr:hypothetical protein BVY03_04585 [bacterium K02(2017)]
MAAINTNVFTQDTRSKLLSGDDFKHNKRLNCVVKENTSIKTVNGKVESAHSTMVKTCIASHDTKGLPKGIEEFLVNRNEDNYSSELIYYYQSNMHNVSNRRGRLFWNGVLEIKDKWIWVAFEDKNIDGRLTKDEIVNGHTLNPAGPQSASKDNPLGVGIKYYNRDKFPSAYLKQVNIQYKAALWSAGIAND